MKMPKLYTVFTDEKGTTFSWSRVTCSVMVGFAMGWGTYIVIEKQAIPDFTSLALLIGAVYGVNRIGEAFGTDKPKPADQKTA
jgi:hypothetical protein